MNGAYQVTPFRVTAIVGSTVPVSAASQQTVDGTPYGFTGWSDGGASRRHQRTVERDDVYRDVRGNRPTSVIF